RNPRHLIVNADDRSLIAGEAHAFRIIGIDPELMEVVAGGIAFDGRPRFARVGRAIDGRIHDVNQVWVFRIGSDLLEVPAAPPQTLVAGESGPGCACVVRTKDTAEIPGLS